MMASQFGFVFTCRPFDGNDDAGEREYSLFRDSNDFLDSAGESEIDPMEIIIVLDYALRMFPVFSSEPSTIIRRRAAYRSPQSPGTTAAAAFQDPESLRRIL